MSTLMVLPGGRTDPVALPVELAARVDLDGTLAAASTILRVLVPILLRPAWNAGPDYGIVADLTTRWQARIEAAVRRYEACCRLPGWRATAATVRLLSAA